ncbi:hypothetical protein NOGI109294_02360 [Nocardiopsis gilva]|uniref:hypothetical protein n=1 Tax=Nocardiopsis gilva TaxID=280236 RepID=UPI00035F74DA|nr:hypothetical protein [Nocardiopsis gilva]
MPRAIWLVMPVGSLPMTSGVGTVRLHELMVVDPRASVPTMRIGTPLSSIMRWSAG